MVRDGAPALGTVTLAFPDGRPRRPCCCSAATRASHRCPPRPSSPAGASSVDFTISTNAAAPPTIVQIMAAVQNVPRTANLSVNAATPGGPSLRRCRVTPASVTGGSPATGTVRFTGQHERRGGAAVQQQPGRRPGPVGDRRQRRRGDRRLRRHHVAGERHHDRDDHREMVRHHAHDDPITVLAGCARARRRRCGSRGPAGTAGGSRSRRRAPTRTRSCPSTRARAPSCSR